MIYVRNKGFVPTWTYEVRVLGVWQAISRAEIDRQLRRGLVIYWNPRVDPSVGEEAGCRS